MTEQIILNTDGLPFTDINNADQVAAILSRETGSTYMVTRHSDGYGLLCRPAPPSSSFSLPAGNQSHAFEEMRFRPAWRSQLIPMGFVFIGVFIYVFTDRLLALVGADNIHQTLAGLGWQFDWQIVVQATSLIALGFSAYFILLMLYTIYSQDYFVGPKGVEANTGLFTKDQTRIEFKHMRGVNLKQSFIERLLGLVGLGYGTINIATSGSEGAEVRFLGIANPKQLLEILRNRLKALA